ncbi:2-keto-4-pentenoate hydratase [Streptacidiphilus sp. N1-3]|uniref:2-keto-4-pentenoate hydratase n=1 Tax=Streptacidiphilus alkalitolerans TaxID=3342712 RepID=A0ABV6X167_9ACTN
METRTTPLPVGAMLALTRLTAARAEHRPCAPVRTLLPPGDVDAAYAVQSAWTARQVAAGARVVGRKVGLTNPAVQAQLGVDQPDFGVLLDSMDCPPGVAVDITRTLQPKIEAEIAFILGRDLTGSTIGPAEAAAATAHIAPALEIVDSRITDWDIGITDTVADNASSGLFTLGAERRRLDRALDLPLCRMTLRRGRELVSEGSGAACMGDPLNALAWLAGTARDHGSPLRAGDIVLSGALGPMVPVGPGDHFHAEISGVGTVSARFTGGEA